MSPEPTFRIRTKAGDRDVSGAQLRALVAGRKIPSAFKVVDLRTGSVVTAAAALGGQAAREPAVPTPLGDDRDDDRDDEGSLLEPGARPTRGRGAPAVARRGTRPGTGRGEPRRLGIGSRSGGGRRRTERAPPPDDAEPGPASRNPLRRLPGWAKAIGGIALICIAALVVAALDRQKLARESAQFRGEAKQAIFAALPGADREYVDFLVDRYHAVALEESYHAGGRRRSARYDESEYAQAIVSRIRRQLESPDPVTVEAFRARTGREPRLP